MHQLLLMICQTNKFHLLKIQINQLNQLDAQNYLIKKIMNSNVELTLDQTRIRPEKSEVNRLWCDNRKIEKLCNFKPNNTIEQGLTKTIEWFRKKENLLKYKADIYNV